MLGQGARVAMTQFMSWIRAVKVKHLLVLMDACYSGSAIGGTRGDPPGDSDNATADRLMRLASRGSRFVITAGAGNERAHENLQWWQGGLFTYAVLTGLVPYTQLRVPDPIALGIDVIGMPWLSLVIKVGALTGLTTVILVLLYGQSRILFTISQDGLLPPVFRRVHARLGTPHLSQFWIGSAVAVVAGLVPIHILCELVEEEL